MVQWSLYKAMGCYQAKTGKPMGLNEPAKQAGLARSIVMSAANGESKRVDLKTLNRPLGFVTTERDPISVAALLEYVLEEPQPQ